MSRLGLLARVFPERESGSPRPHPTVSLRLTPAFAASPDVIPVGFGMLIFAALRMALNVGDSRNLFAVATIILLFSATAVSWSC